MGFQIIKLTSLANGAFEELESDRKWMQVPRCDQCKHWDHDDITSEQTAECLLPAMSAKIQHYDRSGLEVSINFQMRTKASFGCVQWEAK